MAARRPPTAIRCSDRTTREAASAASRSAPTIASRRTRWPALRIAGGGTNFSVNGLGSGRSDLFQAGAFVRHTVGPAYIAGRAGLWLAGHHHRPHRDRRRHRSSCTPSSTPTPTPAGSRAAIASSRRGWRIGITPYAAGQFTTFDLPAYAEQAIAGAEHLRAELCAPRDVTDVAQRTRPAHRQILRDAERRS